jgi:hypothetical protein
VARFERRPPVQSQGRLSPAFEENVKAITAAQQDKAQAMTRRSISMMHRVK